MYFIPPFLKTLLDQSMLKLCVLLYDFLSLSDVLAVGVYQAKYGILGVLLLDV